MDFHGIITPMITPVKNNKIDFETMGKLVNYLYEINVEGLFPASSTGAFTLFSFNDHRKLIEFTSRNIHGGKIFLPGISRNNLEETIKMGRIAIDNNANGVVIITPFYLKFDQDDLYMYYGKIAEELDIPIFVYNNPDLSSNTIFPETLEKLFENYSNIVGIKDSSGDMRRFNSFLSIMPSDRYIFQGRDDLLYESLILGASGGVCGTSNFSPLVHSIYMERDLDIHRKIVKIVSSLRKFPNHVSYNYIFRKKVLLENKPVNYAMQPYGDLSENDEMVLDMIMEDIKSYEQQLHSHKK